MVTPASVDRAEHVVVVGRRGAGVGRRVVGEHGSGCGDRGAGGDEDRAAFSEAVSTSGARVAHRDAAEAAACGGVRERAAGERDPARAGEQRAAEAAAATAAAGRLEDAAVTAEHTAGPRSPGSAVRT